VISVADKSFFPRPKAGFTLIEIMLAIAILAIILVMLAGSFHAVATSRVQAENNIAVDSTARAILGQMAKEIRGAVQTAMIPSRVLLVGNAHFDGGRRVDSISVSTLNSGHRRALENFGAEDTVTYNVRPNSNHRGWFLLLRDQSSSLLENTNWTKAIQRTVLAGNLLSLRIRYFDGNNWSDSWSSQSLPPGRQLPNEVAIELTMATPSGRPLMLATMVSLPMSYLQW
jgi:prepilin-type N-terminal cleavage/methylation domain-containing protein